MLDVRRLQREFATTHRLYPDMRPVQFCRGRVESWPDVGVITNILGRRVIGRFQRDHPYEPPRFTIDPRPSSRHYYDDGRGDHLCWCSLDQYNPDWTIATGLGAVHRFLGLLDRGKVD